MRKRVGQYNIQQPNRPIGHGQSAAVYLATHRNAPRETVALKLFHLFVPEERVQKTFLRETQIITRLNHPNIIRILHIGFDENNPYYVMSYAPNGNLRSRVASGSRLSPEDVDVYLRQIAAAIQHVHDNGLVHCDLKPENILIAADGTLLLSDFGITRSIQTIQAQSTQGAAGTPLYMAPEQFIGKPDMASDQYALGVVAYELLAGRTPFTGNNAVELMGSHTQGNPPSLTAKNPAVSPCLETVVFRALEKMPEKRFPNVLDFAWAFHEVVHRPVEATPVIYREAREEVAVTEPTDEVTVLAKKRAIGQRLRRERERRGWTQEHLSKLISYSVSAVSSWENGRILPARSNWELFASAFETSVEVLFSELYVQVPSPSYEKENQEPQDEHPYREESLPVQLTPREFEVLQLLTRGQTNRQIAQNLMVSVSTVKIHVEHILAKLDVSDRTHAAVRAIELGLQSSGINGYFYNPYAVYAQGKIVKDAQMFYGRDEIIREISEAITNSYFASKTIIIFGQKRSGMSSILYHLHRVLEQYPDLLSVNLESISLYFDETSSVPILYQILWSILEKLKYEIERDIDNNPSSPVLSLPEMRDFYNHPAPFHFFKETMKNFIKARQKQIVVLLDDFSYLYMLIMQGRLPSDFMKSWKSLLQENFFSCVLSGDDLMPRFRIRFPNELDSTEDLRVGPLSPENAVRLIDEPIRIGGKAGESRYRGRAIERIVALTAGYPFYIQLFCNRLVEYMNRIQTAFVVVTDVDQVELELIQGANSLGWEVFDHLINSGYMSTDAISKEDVTKVLTAIAFNSSTEQCSLKNIMDTAGETQAAILDILEDLEYRHVIERYPMAVPLKEHYYRISVELFRDWLITHSVRS